MSTRLRALVLPGIATLIALTILVGLGVWQVQRLAWKTDLIARVEAGLEAPPVAAPGPAEWPALDVQAAEYRRVTVTGTYGDPRYEVYVAYTLVNPKGSLGGTGFMVMRPLLTTGGWTVYVNRGFVPSDRRYPNQRPEGEIEGVTTVTGLLRAPYRAPWFISDGVSDNIWFSRDPQLYAETYGAPSSEVAPYIIDAAYDPGLPGGLPQGGETLVQFPNSHLGYAITWFGLAAALAAVFGVYAARVLRAQGEDGDSSS